MYKWKPVTLQLTVFRRLESRSLSCLEDVKGGKQDGFTGLSHMRGLCPNHSATFIGDMQAKEKACSWALGILDVRQSNHDQSHLQ